MEPFRGTPKFALEEDYISSMPEIVVTNILDRLLIQDAVRTSILSTNWRFKWTFLSQLVFDEKFFEDLVGPRGTNTYKLKNVIGFLLHLKGSITKFVLRVPQHMIIDVLDINHWFLFLSGRGVKDVTVLNHYKTPLKLPTHLFSFMELEHLMLHNCSFHPPLSFHGFPNLLRIVLNMVRFESYNCGELITRCPLPKNLCILDCILSHKVKLAEIAKLKNPSFLILSLSTLDISPLTTSSIFQFVGFFPELPVLRLDFKACKFLAETHSRKGVPTSFPFLKTLQLYSIDFGNSHMVSYVFEMIYCSPNLQNLTILGSLNSDVPPTALCSSDGGRNTVRKLQLRSVVFERLRGSENEVCLIKSLLAYSPLLKTMCIKLNSSSMVGGADGKLMFANKLLKLYRASPVVEIDLL